MKRLALITAAVLIAGCNSKPTPAPSSAVPVAAAPTRPTVPPASFKLLHQTKDSLTLVTDENATDDQVAALVFQLHDAAHHNSFDALHLPQKFIDARDPIVWFHIYRGGKCASEKYTPAKLPCGPSYHAAADYTLGSFSDKNRDEGVLLKDENHPTQLWNPDSPKT